MAKVYRGKKVTKGSFSPPSNPLQDAKSASRASPRVSFADEDHFQAFLTPPPSHRLHM